MAVAFDAVGPSSAGTGSTSSTALTWSHTLTGSNLGLLVGVSLGATTAAVEAYTLSVTCAGAAMTSLGKVAVNNATASGYVQLFGLVGVAAGTQSITVTASGTPVTLTGGSVSVTGAGSFGTAVTAYGNTASSAVTVTGTATTNLVVSVVGGGSPLGAVSGVSTSRWLNNYSQATGAGDAAMATAPSAAGTVTMTRALTSDFWGEIAVEVKAATATSSAVTDPSGGTAEAIGGPDTAVAESSPDITKTDAPATAEASGSLDSPAIDTFAHDGPAGVVEALGGVDAIAATPVVQTGPVAEASGGADSLAIGVADTVAGAAEAFAPVSGRPHVQDDPILGAAEAFGNSGDTVAGATAGTLSNLPILRVLADFTAAPPTIPKNTHGDGSTVEITRDLPITGLKIGRGRQYELGQAEAGTAELDVQDPYELLNPANTSSAYNTGSGGATQPYTVFGTATPPGLGPATVSSSGTGAVYAYDFTVNDPSAALTAFRFYRGDLTIVGPVTASLYVAGNTTVISGTTITFTLSGAGWQTATLSTPVPLTVGTTYRMAFSLPGVGRMSIGGSAASTTYTSGPTTLNSYLYYSTTAGSYPGLSYGRGISVPLDVTVTGVAPRLRSYRPVKVTAVWNQVQYILFTGFIERYPQTWINAGFRGVKPLECVDALGILANIPTHQSYYDTVMADSPSLWIPYTDQNSPGTVYVSNPKALVAGGSSLPGNPRKGTSAYYQTALLVGGTGLRLEDRSSEGGQIQWGGDSMPDGSRAMSMSASRQDTTTYTEWPHGSIDIAGGSFSVDCTNSTIEFWFKWTSGVCNFGVFSAVTDGQYENAAAQQNYNIGGLVFGGILYLNVNLPGYGSFIYPAASTFDSADAGPDDQWHYVAITFFTKSNGTYSIRYQVDNGATTWSGSVATPVRLGVNSIRSFATTAYGDPTSSGSIFGLSYYSYALSDVQTNAHYLRGVGNVGESVYHRVYRLANRYYPGGVVVAGAESERLDADFDYGVVPVPGGDDAAPTDPDSVLAAFQKIDLAHQGFTYADSLGNIAAESRVQRSYYAASSASISVVGDRPALGEYPYTDIEYDFDPTYIYSQTQLTKSSSNQVITQTADDVQAVFGARVFTQTLQLQQEWDIFQYGMYFLARYGVQVLRVRSITFDPSATPSLWPFVLALELSTRLRVNRRTAAGVLITGVYFVEHISHDVDASASTWKVTCQLSPGYGAETPRGTVGDSVLGVLGSTTTVTF